MNKNYYKYILILSMAFMSLWSNAQTFDEANLKELKFRNVGPAGMSGRVTAIDVDLSNDNRIFVGTASGGLWLSEDGGVAWKPIFDKNNTLSIGSIKINQSNPAEIWVGTGEGNPRNSLNTGNGIYKSIDGGKTWKHMGLKDTKTIHRIIIDEQHSNTVYAACPGATWGPSTERGVFKTIDGGKSWKKILYVNDETGAADMIVDPTNPNKIIVAMWEHGRKPWYFNSGGKGSGLYITYDSGDTWKQITNKEGLPKGDLGRIGLAIAPSKPNILYALVEAKDNGLYKSSDGGENWTLVSKENIGNRPFYYAELNVDPSNENRIFNIYTYVSRSEDGGKTFVNIMDYGNNIHPDHHAFWIHPKDPDYMIGGNDGGLTISRDGGHNWTFVNNLPVGQFYHVNVDQDFPYNIYGGMQDNGSWVGPSSVLKNGGIRNSDFRELSFGDGFDVVPYPADSRYGYSMSQGGYVGFYDRETGHSRYVKPLHPGKEELRFNWNAAIAQDPYHDCGVFFGSQYLHRSNDCGESWTIISPDLTTDDTTKQKYDTSGGLTTDATGAENHTTILAIAPSPLTEGIIWVGTDDGNLQLTTDGGKSWQNLTKNIKGAPKCGWIPQIEVSKYDAGSAFVVINNYRQNDYKPYLFFTKDYGKTWTSLVTPTFQSFILSIVQDPVVPNLLYCGADDGLYVSFDFGKQWHHFTTNLPQVQVADIKIQERERDLVLGTFGRSIWILDDLQLLRDMALDSKVLEKGMHLSDIPDAYIVSYRSVDGGRFIAQGEFVGDNDNIGDALISIWVKPTEKEGSEKQPEKDKNDKLKITVLDMKKDTIRQFSTKASAGLNRIYWGLEANGVDFPSKRKRDADSDPPGGITVLPGTYNVIVEYNGIKDSSDITIKYDPRREVSKAQLQANIDANTSYNEVIKAAKKAFDLIGDARYSIDFTNKLLLEQDTTVKNDIEKYHKQFNTRLDSLEKLFMSVGESKGITRNPDNLTSTLYTARSYIRSSIGAPNGNAILAIAKAKEETAGVVKAVNAFFDKEWEAYKVKAEAIKPKLFKDIVPVEIKE